MYGSDYSSLHYNRPSYEDGRRRPVPGDYSWQKWTPRSNNNYNGNRTSVINRPPDDHMANNSHNPPRRTRYSRSSTASVAQLLSDSCTSLLQKLTTRVRGPSASAETSSSHNESKNNNNNYNQNPFFGGHPLTTSKSSTVVPNFGATRSRLEDKYSSVLDKIYHKKRYSEHPDEPVSGRTLSKSSTTTNVLLSEKAYPYVSKVPREKTPYRGEGRHLHHNNQWRQQQYPEPPYSYLDRDSAYRVRHRSNHSELRPRKSSKPHRSGISEATDRKVSTSSANLKLCPVEIPLNDEKPVAVHAPTNSHVVKQKEAEGNSVGELNATSGVLTEREAKRKEIQSLIKKYSALDEFYNRLEPSVSAATSQNSQKAQKTNSLAPQAVQNATTVVAQKYYHPKVAASV
ncbi:hypothetical protein HHI36_013455, partial [Cryptolaemus montrouzieri]